MQFKTVRGLKWPAIDQEMMMVMDYKEDLRRIQPFLENKRVAIQAGGAAGIWPMALANIFNTVYTFEPNPEHFICLCENTNCYDNIIRFQSALGNEKDFVEMNTSIYPTNTGAWFVQKGGVTPTLKIDDFRFPVVDFICLDIEGYEVNALKGAIHTLVEHQPLVMIESKQLRHYKDIGIENGDSDRFLLSMGYKELDRIHRDVIYGPS